MTGQVHNVSRTGTGALTDDQVREIRQAKELYYERKEAYESSKKAVIDAKAAMRDASKPMVAERMGVSLSMVDSVWNDRAYFHVV